MLRYFSPLEFERCSPSCSIEDMDKSFLAILDAVRDDCGFPFVLTSAYRSASYDRSRGRSGRGYHTLGRAVDVRCTDSAMRAALVAACVNRGLSVGIAKTFVHIDNRELRDPIAFLY